MGESYKPSLFGQNNIRKVFFESFFSIRARASNKKTVLLELSPKKWTRNKKPTWRFPKDDFCTLQESSFVFPIAVFRYCILLYSFQCVNSLPGLRTKFIYGILTFLIR